MQIVCHSCKLNTRVGVVVSLSLHTPHRCFILDWFPSLWNSFPPFVFLQKNSQNLLLLFVKSILWNTLCMYVKHACKWIYQFTEESDRPQKVSQKNNLKWHILFINNSYFSDKTNFPCWNHKSLSPPSLTVVIDGLI